MDTYLCKYCLSRPFTKIDWTYVEKVDHIKAFLGSMLLSRSIIMCPKKKLSKSQKLKNLFYIYCTQCNIGRLKQEFIAIKGYWQHYFFFLIFSVFAVLSRTYKGNKSVIICKWSVISLTTLDHSKALDAKLYKYREYVP